MAISYCSYDCIVHYNIMYATVLFSASNVFTMAEVATLIVFKLFAIKIPNRAVTCKLKHVTALLGI